MSKLCRKYLIRVQILINYEVLKEKQTRTIKNK